LWKQNVGSHDVAGSDWDIKPGTIVTRSYVHERYGGALDRIKEEHGHAIFGMVLVAKESQNVFVYAAPRDKTIYPYDGWSEDDTVFLFTGRLRGNLD
jgi:hypothetical protein